MQKLQNHGNQTKLNPNPNGPNPILLDLSKNLKNIMSEPNPNPNPKPKSPNPILKRGVKIHQKVAKGVRAHEPGPAQIQSHLLLGLSKNFKNIVTEPRLNPNPKPETPNYILKGSGVGP